MFLCHTPGKHLCDFVGAFRNMSKSDNRDAASSFRRFHALDKTSPVVLELGALRLKDFGVIVRFALMAHLREFPPQHVFWREGLLKEGDALIKLYEEQLRGPEGASVGGGRLLVELHGVRSTTEGDC